MTKEELIETLNKNLDNIFTVDGYKKILNRANSLSGFDVINRMLIHMQFNDAYDVKIIDEWELKNRHVKSGSKPIYIIIPSYKIEYKDNINGNIFNSRDTDLNLQELQKAIDKGLVTKIETVADTNLQQVYDIRQTYSNGNNKYEVTKPVVNIKMMLGLYMAITYGKIEVSDKSEYDFDSNKLSIRRDACKFEQYSIITEAIANFIVSQKLVNIAKSLSIDILDWSEYEIQLIKNSLQYSILTLFRQDNDIDFSSVSHIQKEKLMSILNLVDLLILDVTYRVKFEGGLNATNMTYHIERLNKSDALLSIMEANDILNKMKGA